MLSDVALSDRTSDSKSHHRGGVGTNLLCGIIIIDIITIDVIIVIIIDVIIIITIDVIIIIIIDVIIIIIIMWSLPWGVCRNQRRFIIIILSSAVHPIDFKVPWIWWVIIDDRDQDHDGFFYIDIWQ